MVLGGIFHIFHDIPSPSRGGLGWGDSKSANRAIELDHSTWSHQLFPCFMAYWCAV